ncbi:MAG: glycosyltransferase [Alloprevotella sp.]|nr:glycosyltransferase [Alloprevotella sp.]
MKEICTRPDYIFETSWEVCNKVGGIYTVLSSHAKVLQEIFPQHLIFIGPDAQTSTPNPDFIEDNSLYPVWQDAFSKEDIGVRIGYWQIEGSPIAILVDYSRLWEKKNQIYADAWALFGVDSLHSYGDYDEASLFSYAAGKVVAILCQKVFDVNTKIVYQAHEWMSGLGMLFLKHKCPQVATLFTTHATSIGRSITSNGKMLYRYFTGYNGDQMAKELNMEAKHSVERQSAHRADCFTTVSSFTNSECRQLLEKSADKILPNGFDTSIVPQGIKYTQARTLARRKIFSVAEALTGRKFKKDTLIISTSGRNDYRCKGMDVFIASLKRLEDKCHNLTTPQVLALIEVPCWTKQARPDLQIRLTNKQDNVRALDEPFITHELYNLEADQIVSTLRAYDLTNIGNKTITVLLIPCYLDGNDGIINLSYYEALMANDLTIYPSYYEPWGYTPLESCAFKIPTITTNLSGFGQWVEEEGYTTDKLNGGVLVLNRNDENFEEVVDKISDAILEMGSLSTSQRQLIRRKVSGIAEKAHWKHFISHYLEAYSIALNQIN